MSSVSVAPLARRTERPSAATEWGEGLGRRSIAADMKQSYTERQISPISVEHGKLEINSASLETERVCPFEYLGSRMALWKLPNGTIEIYEILER